MQELEERIAHLERMLDELSDVVRAQAEELTHMIRVVEALRQRAAEEAQMQGGGVVIGDERPPHY